jgi:Rps23 Pro-64 3,4-dihydroxylase Tpa1-like proline 4-hydroxylase
VAGGARYTRHVDNPNNNGRKLTAILYLNTTWQPGEGE